MAADYAVERAEQITFVLCAKRHHVRFFPSPRDAEGKAQNVPAGTVVDSGVTDPRGER